MDATKELLINDPGSSAFGKRAQIWHAFNVLDEKKKGEVQKSQLKVLSHNLIISLEASQSDDAIDSFDSYLPSCGALSFDDYMKFIDGIFSKVFRRLAFQEDTSLLAEKIDKVCWFICSKSYVNHTGRLLDESNCFKLWCVFNVLAHTDVSEEPICPVEMDTEELEIVVQKIHRIFGIVYKKENIQQHANTKHHLFSFLQFLKVVEKYLFGADITVVNTVASELHEEYVLGVLKKGYLTKKGHFITNWKERWCILTPNTLRYFVSRDEKELKGEIRITDKCTVQNFSDKIGSKQNRFILRSEGKDYEICAQDPITKNEWITALTMAINCQAQSNNSGLTKAEIRQRRISRLARREKLTEEESQKLLQKQLMEVTHQQLEQEMAKRQEIEAKMRKEEEDRLKDQELMAKTRVELEAVRKARSEAEERWAKETARLQREKEHLKELQELYKQLELQLEKERHAREQEELSRKRQEEITEAAMRKERELEEIQVGLKRLLLDEKQKREDLEEKKHQQEALLSRERRRLEQLETERKQRDLEYQIALDKLQEAELEKEEAHRLLRKKKETSFGSALYKFVEGEANDEILVNPGSHRGRGFLAEDSFKI